MGPPFPAPRAHVGRRARAGRRRRAPLRGRATPRGRGRARRARRRRGGRGRGPRSAPTIPESTSPVPAVARRGDPDVTSGHAPDGVATTVVDPFNSTTAPVADASRRAAAEAVGAGWCAREPRELAVVRREHGEVAPAARATSRAESAPPRAASPSASTSDGDLGLVRRAGGPRPAASARCRVPGRRRAPGSAATRRAPPRRRPVAPAAPRHRLGRRQRAGRGPRDHQADHPGARPRRAAAAAKRAAPVIPGEPATHATAAFHLWLVARRAPGAGGEVAVVDRGPGRRDRPSMPIGASSTTPASAGPSPKSSPGLRAAIVTVASALVAPAPASPVSASRPDGTSTASTARRSAASVRRYSPLKPVP